MRPFVRHKPAVSRVRVECANLTANLAYALGVRTGADLCGPRVRVGGVASPRVRGASLAALPCVLPGVTAHPALVLLHIPLTLPAIPLDVLNHLAEQGVLVGLQAVQGLPLFGAPKPRVPLDVAHLLVDVADPALRLL